MRLLALCSLLLVGCAMGPRIPDAAPSGNCAWRVCVTWQDTRFARVYEAENREPVPVTVLLTFRALENLRPLEGRRVERVVPPRSVVLIRVDAIEPRRPMSADVAIAIDLGASDTEPDDFVYAVPFGGTERRRLVQGFEGIGTHRGSMRYALDFLMPQGTPVLAARAGIVLLVQDGFTEGSPDPDLLERANLVVVAHSDGTMASYGHLRPGLAVAVGDGVAEGDELGRSGRTGFAAEPHLHFHVGVRMLGEPGRTVPIKLRDGDGQLVDLVEGVMVTPAQPRSP